MQALKGLGVRFAIDDFGTGYSSLTYLKRLPLDRLKIDRSFVEGLEQAGSDAALVDTILAIGHNLGLECIAEGIEASGQHQSLRARLRPWPGLPFQPAAGRGRLRRLAGAARPVSLLPHPGCRGMRAGAAKRRCWS